MKTARVLAPVFSALLTAAILCPTASAADRSIEGHYRIVGGLRDTVTIANVSGDEYRLFTRNWEGRGFFDGERLRAIIRDHAWSTRSGHEDGPQDLVAIVGPDSSLSVSTHWHDQDAVVRARWLWIGPIEQSLRPYLASPSAGGDVLGPLPTPLSKPPPVYPKDAIKRGITGTVSVLAFVDRDGSVKDVSVMKSIPGLDEAALAAVRHWRFTPAMSGGQAVACLIVVPVRFALH
jgi:TonB family protein